MATRKTYVYFCFLTQMGRLPFLLMKQTNSTKNKFVDGFMGETPLCEDKVHNRLKGPKHKDATKTYNLHGSFLFLKKDENEELLKISAKNRLGQKITDTYKELKGKPLIVFESDSESKKHKINKSIYLKKSFEMLENIKGHLLVFGVSFLKDEHILKAILENEDIKTIYITFQKEEDKKTIESKINTDSYKKEVKFIPIGKNVLWKNTLYLCQYI